MLPLVSLPEIHIALRCRVNIMPPITTDPVKLRVALLAADPPDHALLAFVGRLQLQAMATAQKLS